MFPVLAARSGGYLLSGLVTVTMTLLRHAPSGTDLAVSRSIGVSAPPAAVWAVVGDFCDIRRWLPRTRSCTLYRDEGEVARSLVVSGVGTLVERQLDRDDGGMTYSYDLAAGPWPVRRYRSTITVAPHADGARVTWRATFHLDDATDAGAIADIEEIYRGGLAGIAREAER